MIITVAVIMLAIVAAITTLLASILPWWADTLYAMVAVLWVGVWIADSRLP